MQIIDDMTTVGFDGKETTSPLANLAYGNMGGDTTNLTRTIDGKQFEEYFSAEVHLSQDVIPFVLRTPKLFDILRDESLGKRLRDHWINTMTVVPKSITGLKRTLTAEFSETAMGGNNQVMQQVIGGKRERAEPSNDYVERKGKVISGLHEFLFEYAGMSPESKYNIMAELDLKPGYVEKGKLPSNIYLTGTMLYVEPCAWKKNCVEAYVCGNMTAMTFAENSSKRNLSESKSPTEFSIAFTSIDVSTEGARILGQAALDGLSAFNKNPNNKPAFMNDSDVRRALDEQFGYHEEVWK